MLFYFFDTMIPVECPQGEVGYHSRFSEIKIRIQGQSLCDWYTAHQITRVF